MATRRIRRGDVVVILCSLILLLVAFSVPRGGEAVPLPAPRERPARDRIEATRAFRDAALAGAKVWSAVDPAQMDLGANPPDPHHLLTQSVVRCRFVLHKATGTTPKFHCALPNGEVVKVKYGRRTGEVHAELAASRLATALGFGADLMYFVPRVRCFGCPRFPYHTTWLLDSAGAGRLVLDRLPDSRFMDFTAVAVERHLDGVEVTSGDIEGWAWHELYDPPMGDPRRAELDAFRLLAVFLAHWDNKATNQRLVCLPPVNPGGDRCERPFAFIQDLGATFGPNKVDLAGWRDTPIWADDTSCRVSMRSLPHGGSTFPDARIGEAGRTLLARQLQALDDDQIAALFTRARVHEFRRGRDGDVREWVRVFQSKVSQIVERAPCTL